MNQTKTACCKHGQMVGIVSANMQQISNIYPAQTALLRGTLYPELDKPMACAASPSGAAVPSRNQMMNFAAWDVRLYLDTHPEDASAVQLYQQICQQMTAPGYACSFVNCVPGRWSWTDDPWPWEYEASSGRA